MLLGLSFCVARYDDCLSNYWPPVKLRCNGGSSALDPPLCWPSAEWTDDLTQLCDAAPYMVGCWLWDQCKVGGAACMAAGSTGGLLFAPRAWRLCAALAPRGM